MSGRVTSVQRSSYHDGPGLRTTVFFKGCQLHCPWCHNPETISPEIQTLFYPEKCIGCGKCAEGCFAGARETVGRDMTVDEVLREIELDAPFYGEEGGVTLSGGEPLLQRAFALELIGACRARGLHVAMESNLCVPGDAAAPVLESVDLLMGDVKLWDGARHREITGMDNAFALSNFRMAASMGVPVILRTPVVPGVNDDEAEIAKIAGFAAGLETLLYYELLSYHPLGVSKARALGMEPQVYAKPDKALMNRLREAALRSGVRVLINGREGAVP